MITLRGSLSKGGPTTRYEGKGFATQYVYLKIRALAELLDETDRERLAQAGLDGETVDVGISFPADGAPQAQPPLPGLGDTPPPVEVEGDTVTLSNGSATVTVTAAEFSRAAAVAERLGSYDEAQERFGWRKGDECVTPDGEVGIVHDFGIEMITVRTGQGIGELVPFDPQDLRRREGT